MNRAFAIAFPLLLSAVVGAEGDVTRAPAVVYSVPPVFPEEARRAHLSAEVLLQVDISAEGEVANVTVLRGAGHGFDQAALEAVKQLRFSPGEVDGRPTPMRVQYTQRFAFTEPPRESAASESPTLVGRVLERGSRKPVVAAAVQVKGQTAVALTDANGAFALHAPEGEVEILVLSSLHQPYETRETVKPGERVEATYYLYPKAFGLYETVVRTQRDPKEVTHYALQRDELESVPGSLGDPVRVIQDLPGVARAAYLSSDLAVRGAAPTDTASYIDGVPVAFLFHFGGGPSIINPEFVDRLDFYPGGFGPEYGRAIGGTLDVKTRAPKSDGFHGSASVDLAAASALLSGPVTDEVTLSVAARQSYFQLALRPLYKAVNSDVVVVPAYDDYQMRVDYRPHGSRSSFWLMGFGADDQLELAVTPASAPSFSLHQTAGLTEFAAGWNFRGGAFNNTAVLFAGRLYGDTNASLLDLTERDWGAGVREKLEIELSPAVTVRAGLDVFAVGAHFFGSVPASNSDYVAFPGGAPSLPPVALDGHLRYSDSAGWMEGEIRLGRLKLLPGLRAEAYTLFGRVLPAFDPRLTVRWEVGPKERPVTIKGMVGSFHESAPYRDLTDVFGNPNLPLQAAFQSSLGVEYRFLDALHVEVTGFYNRRYDLATPTDATTVGPGGTIQPVFFNGDAVGRAWGLEVLARQELTHNLFGWLAYTLSGSQVHDPGQPYQWASYDERHILTAVAQYRFGNGWSVGGRFRLATGMPTTPVASAVLDSDQQTYLPVNGPASSARLPTFHQLDVRVDREWLFKLWKLGAYLDVQNVYDAPNQEGVIYDYRYRTDQLVRGLPIFPTLGVKGLF